MLFVIIIIAIIVIAVLNFAGQGAATYNLKQQNKESMNQAQRNYEDWAKRTSKEQDIYYSHSSKSLNDNFYSDGSLKIDPYTKKTYAKGEFRCDSRGNKVEWQKAGPNEKRPPAN